MLCQTDTRCIKIGASPEDYLSRTHYIFSLFITNNVFLHFWWLVLWQITQKRGWREESPTFEQEREVCFGNLQNYFGISDEIGNLLEHLSLPKGHIFGIRERGE